MRVRSRAGLPLAPWRGRAVLVFRRTAWFSDGQSTLGVLERGIGPSPGGIELETSLPRLQTGARLESDGAAWFLEGVGELEGAFDAPDSAVTLGRGVSVSPGWKARWRRALVLPPTPEGRWLASLWDGPGADWESLIGRGSGSTPLGDDYLAGWLAARLVLGAWAAEDRGRLLRSLAGTSRLSRHYLWHLADGRVDPALGAFLAATPLPEPNSAEASELASRGDLSGRATLVGLVAGATSQTGV